MKKFILKVEVEVDEEGMYGTDPEGEAWFLNAVLLDPSEGEGLVLRSNCIGDEVGPVKVLEILEPETVAARDRISGCESCARQGPFCPSSFQSTEFGQLLCTRAPGHAGDHVACGYMTHGIARWKDGEEENS